MRGRRGRYAYSFGDGELREVPARFGTLDAARRWAYAQAAEHLRASGSGEVGTTLFTVWRQVYRGGGTGGRGAQGGADA